MNIFIDLNNIKTRDFEILEYLGRGSMGEAYLAEYRNRLFVLKFVKKDKSSSKNFELSQRIIHKNFIKCFGYFIEKIDNHMYYISILEFFQGYELSELILNNTLFVIIPIKNIKRLIIGQLTDALEYLHNINLVHRDIKPENILINQKGEIKIIDYDFLMDCNSLNDERCGTVYYVSPEILSYDMYDQRTDLWSLGVTIYLLLTGLYPFDGDSVVEVSDLIVNSEPDFSFVPKQYKVIIKGLLQKNPPDRITLKEIQKRLKFMI